MTETTYPEHEKLKALGGANNTVGNFLSWLSDEGYTICRFDEKRGEYFPTFTPIQEWIAQFFEIDPVALENEKVAMLDMLRAAATER